MRLEFNWGVNIDFPWLEKIHDYVWPGEDEDE
jgi:hypothetical protein